ncbi:hypothetical protein COO60DRAFT_689824 [Scenedesmus sp. NREL 46B-D3]|nr:hypothetical protein COO60DRAFT_689824 [Scenedesmus sp. NREL 46B-D3]
MLSELLQVSTADSGSVLTVGNKRACRTPTAVDHALVAARRCCSICAKHLRSMVLHCALVSQQQQQPCDNCYGAGHMPDSCRTCCQTHGMAFQTAPCAMQRRCCCNLPLQLCHCCLQLGYALPFSAWYAPCAVDNRLIAGQSNPERSVTVAVDPVMWRLPPKCHAALPCCSAAICSAVSLQCSWLAVSMLLWLLLLLWLQGQSLRRGPYGAGCQWPQLQHL